MSDTTETHEDLDPSRWPVPEGTRMTETMTRSLEDLLDAAGYIESGSFDLIKTAPVKADEEAWPVYLHDLATLIDKIEWAVDILRETQAEVAATFARALPYGTAFVAYPDLRPMKPRFPKDRKAWDNELLQAAVIRRLVEKAPRLGNMDTGETYDPRELVDAVLDVVSLNGSNAKTGGIKRLDLDPDDYCQSEKKDPQVQVTK